MVFLTRTVNSVGFQERNLPTIEDRQKFVGGYFSCVEILDSIDIWFNDDVHEMNADTLNLIIRYGKDDAGNMIEQHIYGSCYFASSTAEGETIPLRKEDLRKLIKRQYNAKLISNNNIVMIIDASN